MNTRQCMGCNARKEKIELLRIVREPSGKISLDCSGKINGRGTYICRDAECLKRSKKSRRMERMLKSQIGAEVYEMIEDIINGS